jgi:hypothetical protein
MTLLYERLKELKGIKWAVWNKILINLKSSKIFTRNSINNKLFNL